MRKNFLMSLIMVSACTIALISFGCDTGGSTTTPGCGSTGGDTGGGSTSGICTENLTVSNTGGAKLYYPCGISSATPATTMSSGWTGGLTDVEFISKGVADNGFVVLAFTPSNRYGMVNIWRQGHKACVSKLQDLNRTHKVLSGKIDTGKLQTCGHSKGGGGSLWASSELGSTMASAIGMAPYQGTEFALNVLGSMRAATFIQAAGVSDSLATPSMTRGEYNALPGSIKKCYKRHAGWGHMEWTDTTTANHTQLTNEVVAWSKYYLKGDTSGAGYIEDQTGVNSYEWIK